MITLINAIDKHLYDLNNLPAFLPSGGGFDTGCNIDMHKSRQGKVLVITSAYHFMNETGYYDGWTNFNVIVKPGFDGININIVRSSGRKTYFKESLDFFYDTFYSSLTQRLIFNKTQWILYKEDEK